MNFEGSCEEQKEFADGKTQTVECESVAVCKKLKNFKELQKSKKSF